MNEDMLKMYGVINNASSDSRGAIYTAIGHAIARACVKEDIGTFIANRMDRSDAEATFMKKHRGNTYNYLNFINAGAVIDMETIYEISEHFYVAYNQLLSRLGESAPTTSNNGDDLFGFNDYFDKELIESASTHSLTYNSVMRTCSAFIYEMRVQ